MLAGSLRSTSPLLSASAHLLRDRVHVHLQSELESLFRTEAWPDAAGLFSRYRLVKLELAAPKVLAAERIEAESLASFFEKPLCLIGYRGVKVLATRCFLAHLSSGGNESCRQQK